MTSEAKTVLILTAGVGAGHEAAGRALGTELEGTGHRVVVRDGLDQMGRSAAWLVLRCYAWQLAHAPWLYDAIFALSSTRIIAALSRRAMGRLYGDRILALLEQVQPDVVVSTYPLVTAALGRLAARGRSRRPVVALISDFGVHPLWTTPEAALHVVPSHRSAKLVTKAGGRVSVARFPVASGFADPLAQQHARCLLGLPPNAFIPLIVGGAWGVGDLAGAVDRAVAAGVYPVVVAGRNEMLRKRLERRYPDGRRVCVLGWSDRLPELMAAADCLVQNAGGVTCLEAMAIGLPILIFHPLPGHGRLNARLMAASGAATIVRDPHALEIIFRRCGDGTLALPRPHRDPGCELVAAVTDARFREPTATAARRPAPRWAFSAAAIVLLTWAALAPWTFTLAAEHFPLPIVGEQRTPGEAAVVVRVDDPVVARAIARLIAQEHLPVLLFVTAKGAEGLVADDGVIVGVAEAPSSFGKPWQVWDETHEAMETVHRATGVAPRYFLPLPGDLDAADLVLAPRRTRVIMPEGMEASGAASGVVVVDTTGLDARAAAATVEQRIAELSREGVRCVPLDALS